MSNSAYELGALGGETGSLEATLGLGGIALPALVEQQPVAEVTNGGNGSEFRDDNGTRWNWG